MKNRQGLTIVILIIAIVGLSIVFAAFSNTLNISLNVSENLSKNAFNVGFSSSSNSVATVLVEPTKDPVSLTAISVIDSKAVVVPRQERGQQSSPTFVMNMN